MNKSNLIRNEILSGTTDNKIYHGKLEHSVRLKLRINDLYSVNKSQRIRCEL